MRVDVNGVGREVEDGTTLASLIEAVTGSCRGSAAALDGEVVPRSEWASCPLRSGQSIELITAMQGG
ncbi:MAG: sulfur carrier protein ThiS [Actinomycetota bacterium]|nr:sulfur carrier protein ThiS [Actinomycetota bacterium]